jgi:predicted transcriptional regulator of viral defense system
MKLEQFIKKVQYYPVIDLESLMVGLKNPQSLKVHISRWQKSGKLIPLKNGLYILANAYRKVEPQGFYVASLLKKPSYVTMEKALEYYDLIPEAVTVYTCVTTKRQGYFKTPIGVFDYRHIKTSYFWGYDSRTLNNQTSFIASPEKALLDLIYLRNIRVSPEYLEELRLQNMDTIKLRKLTAYARRFGKPGIKRAAKIIKKFIEAETAREKKL